MTRNWDNAALRSPQAGRLRLPLEASTSERDAPAHADETLAQQIRRLQRESRELATVHVQCLELVMTTLARLAKEIAEGGDAYHPGVREIASRTATDIEGRARTLCALTTRSGLT